MLRLIKICVAVFISVFAFSSINANESVSAVAVSLSLIQNGGFEKADFSGNYTLNISKATGWGSNNTSDGNSLSGVSGNGVAKTGEYSLGLPGATLGYFTDINARSGDNFAFLLTRMSGGALVDNYIQSSPFSVSQSGLYEFSCGLKNGTKDHGRGATIAIDIVQGQETVSTYSYTIPVEGQDWHLVENQVDLQPGEYFVRFKVIKEGTTENKDQARICIDDVGLRRYLAVADIFNAGTEDGYTVDLTDHLILDGEQSYSLAEGKKLTIDAKGFSIKGKITVNGELTLVNGDFSGCVFSGSGKVSAPAVAVSPLSLIQNGGFEEANFSGNYTLNISKATGWGSNNTSDGNSLSGVSGNGVAKTGNYSLGLPGATLGYFTDIEARSGDNFAFLLTRKSGGALVDNYIQSSSFSVSQSGLYEFSCGLKNGAKDHGRGAMIAIDIVQGQETVSAYSYTIPVEGQDWHLVENQVDLQPGEYFVRFKVIKEGTTENKDQARVCIDDVSLSGKYKTASEIFASASAGGLTAKLSKDIDIFNSVSVESGKKLTIDANGKKVSGAIDVSGEFTILNGDFSGCDVSVQPGGIVFLGAGTAIGSTNGFHVLDGAVACPKPEGGFIVIPRSSAEACANETVYQYVEDAFSMAQAGDTILLLSDASISDELTIDKDLTLAGGEHVFSSSSENAVMVVDGATLTVMDGKFSGIAMVAANGIINISGGQFSATKVLSYMNSDAAQVEGSKAYVNISGGQFGDDCISAVGMIGDVKISDPSNLLSGTVDGNACKLDDVEYSTLDDALKAVNESAQTEFRLTILKGLVITDETQIVIPQNKRILYSGADKALVLRRSGMGPAGDIYVCGELVIEDGCFYDLPINIGIDKTHTTEVKYPGAKLTVNGGDFHNVTMTSYGLDQSDNYIDSVYVNGGTFRDYSKMAVWNCSVFHLTGGKYFVKNNWGRNIYNRAFLYGGIYLAGSPEIAASQDTADRPMLGEGYKVKTITDSVNGGTYYIIAKETTTALNWNTGKVYDNLADAVDDADDGDEIRYFANIENEKEVFIPKNKRIILSATGDFTANAPFLVRGCLILKSVGFTGLFRFGGPGEIITYQDPGDLNVDGASFTRLDDDKWHARCRGFSVIIR